MIAIIKVYNIFQTICFKRGIFKTPLGHNRGIWSKGNCWLLDWELGNRRKKKGREDFLPSWRWASYSYVFLVIITSHVHGRWLYLTFLFKVIFWWFWISFVSPYCDRIHLMKPQRGPHPVILAQWPVGGILVGPANLNVTRPLFLNSGWPYLFSEWT